MPTKPLIKNRPPADVAAEGQPGLDGADRVGESSLGDLHARLHGQQPTPCRMLWASGSRILMTLSRSSGRV